jgi:hypothetical protein
MCAWRASEGGLVGIVRTAADERLSVAPREDVIEIEMQLAEAPMPVPLSRLTGMIASTPTWK